MKMGGGMLLPLPLPMSVSVSVSASKPHFPMVPYPCYSIAHKKKRARLYTLTVCSTSSDKLDLPSTTIEDPTSNSSSSSIEESSNEGTQNNSVAAPTTSTSTPSAAPVIEKDLKKVVNRTAATFAPRASTASKNPAVPGSTLYTVFEIQGYASMFLGGVLSFNLLFPSNEPDIWRLMGMWSIWMFTIPSLRARDCSNKEKEALNYLFLLVPLLNVIIPFFWKSFAVVWSADTVAFFMMYAWKLGWLQKTD